MMDAVWEDLRYSMRTLLRYPSFTLVTIATLALGIGANTAIFTVVDSVLIRSLPYERPEELVEIHSHDPESGHIRSSMPIEQSLAWRETAEDLFSAAVYAQLSMVRTDGLEPEELSVSAVSSDLISILGGRPQIGRRFVPDDSAPGASPVVLLSNEVWRDSFGEDPDVIGETLELDSTSFTVIGVVPQDFRFPRAGMVDVWVPLEQHGTVAGRRVNYGELIARLVDGLSVEQAQERLGGLAAGLNEARPHERVWNVRLVPHDPIRANTDTQRALWVLMTAVVFMLLIAAVNSINLLLARTTVRAREIAVRLALGASRSQVARLLVTEAVLLALTGAALAVAVAKMAIPLILRLMPGELTFFAVTDIVVDARVLVYTFVIAFVVGVTCGAVPALKLVRPSPALPSWAEIYSVLSFAVRQRTRELGIRSALGAGPDALRRMVMGDGLLLAGAGTILGLACALGLTRFLRTLLFGVEPTDPLTFVVVSVLMTAIGAIACWFPARKATQVDPQTALRVE